MSLHIKYGPIEVTLQHDSEGHSFSCPLCHNLFFSKGDTEACRSLVQQHLNTFHKIVLPSATITEDGEEPPKVQVQRPA